MIHRPAHVALAALTLFEAFALAEDRLEYRDGSTVDGHLLGYRNEVIAFETDDDILRLKRADVAAIYFDPSNQTGAGPTAAPDGPPPGISVAEGLSVAQWYTVRQIPHIGLDDFTYTSVNILAINQAGTHFAVATGGFTAVGSLDGNTPTRVLSKDGNPRGVAISSGGSKVAWVEKGGIMVAGLDGSNPRKMPGGADIWTMTISDDGKWIFYYDYQGRGLYAMATDGSDLKQVVSLQEACDYLGIPANGNYWKGPGGGLTCDAKGSKIAFQLYKDALVVNRDGSGLRRLTEFNSDRNDAGLHVATISADGSTVAYYHAYAKTLTIESLDSGEKRIYENVLHGTSALSLSADGSIAALSHGARLFYREEDRREDLTEVGVYAGSGLRPFASMNRALITGDGKQLVALTSEFKEGSGTAYPRISVIELNPSSLEGVPHLESIDIFPRFILNDGTNTATLTVQPDPSRMDMVGSLLMRNGYHPGYQERPGYHTMAQLFDNGRNAGDPTADDGIYTTAEHKVNTSHPAGPVTPGPVTTRLFAYNHQHHLLVVDIEGLEVRKP